jgi:phosphatidylserine/phosphatidylglycerophosphate/cardiolipin synthase-like enzyme
MAIPRYRKIAYVLAFTGYALAFCYFGYQKLTTHQPKLEPYLISDRDVSGVMVDIVNKAQKTIHIAVFNILQQNFMDALYAARNRGVDVKLIIDISAIKSPWSQISKIHAQGIPIRYFKSIDDDGKILDVMHHKYMIVDGKTVETGSNNYTYKGFGVDSRDENDASIFSETMFIVRDDPKFAEQFIDDWNGMWPKADIYQAEKTP